MYAVSHLFVYPVKSLGGFELSTATLTDRGFQYDRRWMVVDDQDKFLTQREYPVMSLLQTAIEDEQLVIFHKENTADRLALPLQPPVAKTFVVKVFDDDSEVQYVNTAANEWLSRQLNTACRLVYMPESSRRKVDLRYAKGEEITSLSDGYPLLILGQASLDDLNNRLDQPLPINRFRPNIVFTGGSPFDEDTMEHFIINGINLYGVKLCARCMITTINQSTADKGKEPLKALSAYRLLNKNIYFGQNVLFDKEGIIRVGDELRVVNFKPHLLPFDGSAGEFVIR